MRSTKKTVTTEKPFEFGCSTAVFPRDELDALSKFGNRLEALARGDEQPVTEADKHFLRVDRDRAEPKTLLERAWLRLKGRREYELEQKGHTTAPPQDYGMIEFDADRCWW
jgi:uncharacterized protein YifE (UPF0438 family)